LAAFARDVNELRGLEDREKDDLNAFLDSGWQFRTEKELDWAKVIAYNRGADIEPGLLARYPGGGLVIIRNRVVLKLKPPLEPEKINEVVPEADRVRITPLRFGVNLFEVVLKIPELDLDLEEALLKTIVSLTANRNVLFCEPTLFYHARTWEDQRKEGVELRKFGIAKKKGELYQWHWDKIEIPKAWQTTRGNGTRVAVIDHGFFDGDIEIIPVTWKALLSQDGNYVGPGPLPRDSHGTFCAGLVGAHDDGKGVNGAAPECGLILVAIQKSQVLSQVALGNALRLCVQGPNGKSEAEGADIICCSLGLNANNWILETGLKEAIDYAHHDGRLGRNGNRGAIVVWATFDQNDPICPNTVEDYRDLIIVSQSDEQDRRRQSGYGAALDLIAPGFWVLGLDYDHQIRGMDTEQGSSFAAPCVAGVAALVLAANPDLTYQQVAEVLLLTCDPDVKPKVRIDDSIGWGRINARRAVCMAVSMKPRGKRWFLRMTALLDTMDEPPVEGAAKRRTETFFQ
jgi:thermitase